MKNLTNNNYYSFCWTFCVLLSYIRSPKEKNKTMILIDDSLVRGTSSVKIIKMIYDAGAKEVHLRIASPPIKYPDYYGVDTPDKNELIASKLNLEEISK